jgi:DNA primase
MIGDEIHRRHLVVPYMNADGNVVCIRYRRLAGEGPKYGQAADTKTSLYRAASAVGAAEVHVTEGEIDCLSLVEAGLVAVGVPGASNWKNWYFPLFEAAEKVFVWGDGDKAGDEFSKRVLADLPDAIRVPVPRGMDVNEVLKRDGVAGVRSLIS